MANYEALKTAIQNAVYENGNNEITGLALQDVLMAIVNSLGSGYQFAGVAIPETIPGTPDQRVFYVASPGIYLNFGVTVDDGCIGFIQYDENGWTLQQIQIQSFQSLITNVQENGFFFVDANGNIGISITNDGLGFAKITEATIEYLNNVLHTGGGGNEIHTVQENGFYFVDANGYIGLFIDNNVVHAINLGDQIKTEKVSNVEYDINI